MSETVTYSQVKSYIGSTDKIRATLKGLGIRRMHESVTRKDSPVRTARHKCAVCGRTELDAPDLEFRYCSKCAGDHEYCSEHLYTHTHVTEDGGEGSH